MVTKTQAKHTYYALDAARRLEFDIYNQIDIHGAIPTGWGEIADRRKSAKKVVTLRLEEDVVNFMKSLGPGYQGRINEVLRVFMHAKLGALMQGPASVSNFLWEKENQPEGRPDWGAFGKIMGER
jgi:uncharacterized protein (DUF4415 family)